jgi:5-methylcytosine-specific restriction endonuclease McrA
MFRIVDVMAINTNKRIAVKWIRDKAKSAYEKQHSCYICNSTNELELHHLHSITHLLEVWAKANNYDISTDQGILSVRDEFISNHREQIYDLVYTLCNRHHVQLHGIYGKSPLPNSVTKQQHWIQVQREKHVSGASNYRGSKPQSGSFSEFTGDLSGTRKIS